MVRAPPAEAEAAVAAELRGVLGGNAVHVDAPTRRSASSDYSWISPILRERLPATVADVVAFPQDNAAVARVLDVAARLRVPVTPRGKGTGNYGQAVPLQRGIVVDLSRHDRIMAVGDGWIEAGGGADFASLERAARRTRQELAMFPSMQRSSLGGFLSGGNQGIGSIEHGSIWDGFVHAIAVVACREDTRPVRTEGDEVLAHLHTYGTAGVLASARVRLVPAQCWTAVFASFADVPSAARAGLELANLDPCPRSVSVDDAELAGLYPAHRGIVAGLASLRALVTKDCVDAAGAVVAAHGGRVEAVDAAAVAVLVTTSFNHSTLRAQRARPELCATQVRGSALLDRYDEAVATMAGGLLHLDANRKQGRAGYSGLLLSTFVDPPSLYASMARLEALGVTVIDPHTWVLGGHGRLDAIRERARIFDPYGLLNPGKLPAPRPTPSATGDATMEVR